MERQFLRISRFIGEDNVELLHRKKVALVGLGAVGGFCLEALVRSGVGRFTLVDFDKVSETNLNRQILALHSTLDRPKSEVAVERALDINPKLELKEMNVFADSSNHAEIFEGADLVIDCIDSLNPKLYLLEDAYKAGIPVISSMGAALRRDPSLIRITDVFDTWGCPLARQVRSGLRRRGVGKGIDCVFSPEKVEFEYRDPESDEEVEFNEVILDRGRKRVVLGSLPTVTAIFGEMMAHLALTKLLPEDSLLGKAEWDPRMK